MLNSNEIQILVVPPWENAGDDHWMSHLQRKYRAIKRVEQRDWDNPTLAEWTATLGDHISQQKKPVILVAHSLGAATAVHWATGHGGNVAAAFLVAPPDLEQADTPPEIAGFGPLPTARLPFPSILAASENDPYISLDRAKYFSDCWGSEFINIGAAGHVNTKSGHGEWNQGEELLARLIDSVVARVAIAGRLV
jgi:uncharacterized protein